MKASVYSTSGKEIKKIDLPRQFDESYRPDLIKRAVIAIQSGRYQPYGSDILAGKRGSVEWHKSRKRKFKTTYTWGISRISRKITARIGGGFFNVIRFRTYKGAFAPQAVKGRRAHPPKVEKKLVERMNIKERRKAICSAIASSAIKEIVLRRGHLVSKINVPLIIENEFEKINKTSKVKELLENLGLKEEFQRAGVKRRRAGRGKTRGRKYKESIGPLIITSSDCNLIKSAKNLPGVDVCKVNDLNAELLAPGTHAGRLTVWSEAAVEKLRKEGLFLWTGLKSILKTVWTRF